jgi:hypothetical protein
VDQKKSAENQRVNHAFAHHTVGLTVNCGYLFMAGQSFRDFSGIPSRLASGVLTG